MAHFIAAIKSTIRSRFSPEATQDRPGRKRSNANAWLGNEQPKDEHGMGAALGHAIPGASSGDAERTAAARRPPKVARHEGNDLSGSLGLAGGSRDEQDRPRPSQAAPSATALFVTSPATTAPTGLGLPLLPASFWRSPRPRQGSSSGGATPGVGALRAVAGGLSATPRTPVRRRSGEEAGVSGGVGTWRNDLGGRKGAGAGVGVGVPSGYAYGMTVLPQTTPRRLIMATARSARVRHTPTAAAAAGDGRGSSGRRPFGGFGSWRRNLGRGGGGASGVVRSSSNGGFNLTFGGAAPTGLGDDGVGDGRRGYNGVVLKSQANRERNYRATISEMRRKEGRGAVTGVSGDGGIRIGRDSGSSAIEKEDFARRSLNDLRSKARKTLEKKADNIQHRNPAAAKQLRADAWSIQNWGKEAEEGSRREAAERAVRRNEALARYEAERAAARKKAATERKKTAAESLARGEEARARARARARAEEEEKTEADRVRAEQEKEEQEGARLEAAAAAAAAAAAVQERPKLSPEQEEQVRIAWSTESGHADSDIVIRAFNDMVSKGSLRTLRAGEWLGDEVINLYMKSLQARNREAVASGKQVPKCGIMSSFFYTQLSDNGRGYRYQGVKRFLKKAKIDLFDLDKFIFPINVNQNHWTLAVINFRLQRLEYYDSLGSPFGDAGFEYMARFVDDESQSKRAGQAMDISKWPRFNYQNLPHQRNGIDCGVFASMFADRLSKGRPLSFSQSDIRHCRQVLTLAILRGERPPTEAEAFLEDGGSVPDDALPWWEPPRDVGHGPYEENEEEAEEDGEEEGCESDIASSDAGTLNGDVEGHGTSNGFDLTTPDGGGEGSATGLFDLTSDGMQENGDDGDDEGRVDLTSDRGRPAEEAGMDEEGRGVSNVVSDGRWESDAAAAADTGRRKHIGGERTPWSAIVPPRQQL